VDIAIVQSPASLQTSETLPTLATSTDLSTGAAHDAKTAKDTAADNEKTRCFILNSFLPSKMNVWIRAKSEVQTSIFHVIISKSATTFRIEGLKTALNFPLSI
jgi:hypothetical protein